MPTHCYGSSYDSKAGFPEDQNIDFEVKWNMDLRDSKLNYDSVFDEKNLVDKLLCDPLRLDSKYMFSDYYYFSRGENQNHVAGYAFDNVPIFNALIVDNHSDSTESVCSTEDCDTIDYHDALEAEVDIMDECLTYADKTTGALHYRSVSHCMKTFNTLLTGTDAPQLCKDSPGKRCTKEPFKWALESGDSFKKTELMDIGLARDGHVIKGPYNENGELWTCDEIDICNGTFLSDGSYAYVAT